MAAGAVVAAIAAQRHRVFKAFREAGAVDLAHARTLEELGIRDMRMLRTLMRQGSIVAFGPRYYLDEAAVDRSQRRGRKTAIVFAILVFVAIILALALAGPR